MPNSHKSPALEMTDLQTWKLSAKPEDGMLVSDAGLKWDSRTEPTTPGIESALPVTNALVSIGATTFS